MFDGTGCEIRMGRTACESRDVPRMSSPAGSAANTSRTLSATFFCQPAPTIRQYRTLVHRGWLIVHGAKLAACLTVSPTTIGAPAGVIVGAVLSAFSSAAVSDTSAPSHAVHLGSTTTPRVTDGWHGQKTIRAAIASHSLPWACWRPSSAFARAACAFRRSRYSAANGSRTPPCRDGWSVSNERLPPPHHWPHARAPASSEDHESRPAPQTAIINTSEHHGGRHYGRY